MIVTLDIDNDNDWQVLKPLLERLQVGIRMFSEKTETTTDDQKKKDWEIIMKGLKKPEFEKFISEFENNRHDRILPFRE
jgi:hypothetical protein